MKITVREMVLASMFAALAGASGLLVRFGGEAAVPFSLLPFVALLAGMLLGGRLAALSMTIYVFLGLVGVPVFASPPYAGPAYLIKPSAGFLFGFIAAAYITGKVTELLKRNTIWANLLASGVGILVLYLIGLPYLYLVLNFYIGTAVNVWSILKIGFLPFIVFDLIKAVIASVIAIPITEQARLASK